MSNNNSYNLNDMLYPIYNLNESTTYEVSILPDDFLYAVPLGLIIF